MDQNIILNYANIFFLNKTYFKNVMKIVLKHVNISAECPVHFFNGTNNFLITWILFLHYIKNFRKNHEPLFLKRVIFKNVINIFYTAWNIFKMCDENCFK